MRPETQGGLLLVVGGSLIGLASTNGFLSYVRAGLRIPLLLAAVFLVVVGLASAIGTDRASAVEDGHGHGPGAARVGVLLLAPVIAIHLIAPAPLGAYAANRGSQNRVVATMGAPGEIGGAVDGAVDMWFGEFLFYAFNRPDSVVGKTVRLVGFSAPEPDVPGAFRLTRFVITCCAADALPMQVILRTGDAIPGDDRWFVVEAEWGGEMRTGGDGSEFPVLDLVSARPIDPPAVPYEY